MKVRKGAEEVELHAPVVVSNCGIFTTFQTLLPTEVKFRPGETQILQILHPSLTFYLVTVTNLLMFRRSGETQHDETWQRVIFGLHGL